MIALDSKVLNSVNRCQISEMEKAANANESCDQFARHVINVQAAIVHTYQMVAYEAIREADPAKAAQLWKEMGDFCDEALGKLKDLKEVYSSCGTPELYDLALDYRNAAHQRYTANLEDAECSKNLPPNGLFQKMS